MSWNARSKLMKFARRGASRHPLSTRALRTSMAAISIWRSSFAKTGRSTPDRSFDLPRHQRHLGDAAQDAKPRCDRLARAQRCRAGIADSDNCRARLRYRENSPRPEGRALGAGLGRLAPPFFADRISPFTEAAALGYGDIMSAALRGGRPMSAPDGMIAAIARNGGRLATRNLPDFETTGLELICPWDF